MALHAVKRLKLVAPGAAKMCQRLIRVVRKQVQRDIALVLPFNPTIQRVMAPMATVSGVP